MNSLLSKAADRDSSGCIQRVTPASAGWKYVGFEVFVLKAGQALKQLTGGEEVCLVLLTGKADVCTQNESWRDIGERENVFARQPPYAVYVPPNDNFCIVAQTDIEVAVCKAEAEGKFPARLIRPVDCAIESRGAGTNQRYVCNILFGNLEAERLLVVEVLTPGGNWSSYPPHKHDTDDPALETRLEETYYHCIDPPQGFAFQRVYTDDRRIDETMSVENRDVVLVPEGYHPVGAPHGYDLYYLNVMAGEKREWIFKNDPDHDWIVNL